MNPALKESKKSLAKLGLKLWVYGSLLLGMLIVLVLDAVTAARGQQIKTTNWQALGNDLMYVLAAALWTVVALANFVSSGRSLRTRIRQVEQHGREF